MREVVIRLKPTTPRRCAIIDFFDDQQTDGRGRQLIYHVEEALLDYIEKKAKEQQKACATAKSIKSVARPAGKPKIKPTPPEPVPAVVAKEVGQSSGRLIASDALRAKMDKMDF